MMNTLHGRCLVSQKIHDYAKDLEIRTNIGLNNNVLIGYNAISLEQQCNDIETKGI